MLALNIPSHNCRTAPTAEISEYYFTRLQDNHEEEK